MSQSWEKYCEAMTTVIRRRSEKKKYLSQFWIWQPYSKLSLSETELMVQGYKNLGDAYPQKKDFQDEW